MVMSMPTSLPSSSSKCHGALVLPVPTMSLPRSRTVRSRLSGADCAAAFCATQRHHARGTGQHGPADAEFQELSALRNVRHTRLRCL